MCPSPAAVVARLTSLRAPLWPSRRPWLVNRKSAGRPVRGCGMGRPGERVAVIRSIRATMSASMGTMRSVSSLRRGTLSQEPERGTSITASSSRSSSSPMRSPQARCSRRAPLAEPPRMLPRHWFRPIRPCRRDQCAHNAPIRLPDMQEARSMWSASEPLTRVSVSTRSAPEGIRTPNLLIRSTRHRLISGSEASTRDRAKWLSVVHDSPGWGHVGVNRLSLSGWPGFGGPLNVARAQIVPSVSRPSLGPRPSKGRAQKMSPEVVQALGKLEGDAAD